MTHIWRSFSSASLSAWWSKKLELVPICRVDRFNPVCKALDLLDLTLSEEGLPVPESMAERNFSGTSPSPESLPRNFEDSG